MKHPFMNSNRLCAFAALILGLLIQSSTIAASFRSTGLLAERRFDHTATLLQNGKVLLAGEIGRAHV